MRKSKRNTNALRMANPFRIALTFIARSAEVVLVSGSIVLVSYLSASGLAELIASGSGTLLPFGSMFLLMSVLALLVPDCRSSVMAFVGMLSLSWSELAGLVSTEWIGVSKTVSHEIRIWAMLTVLISLLAVASRFATLQTEDY